MSRTPRRHRRSSSSIDARRPALLFSAAALCAVLAFATPADARPRGMGGLPPIDTEAAATLPAGATSGVPDSVDLRQWAPPVGDQGTLNSCTSWAVTHGLMGWWAKRAGRAETDFAPMYSYSQLNDGTDSGAYLDDTVALVHDQGNDTVAHYALNHGDADWQTKPLQSEVDNAASFKLGTLQRLFAGDTGAGENGMIAIQNALSSSDPVVVLFPVRPGFDRLLNMSPAPASPPLDTDTTGAMRGYHAALALGYNADGLLIQNSWGTGFGAGGYARLSWDVVKQDIVEADIAAGWGPSSAPTLGTVGGLPHTPDTETVFANTRLYAAASGTATLTWGTTTAYRNTDTQTMSHTPGNGRNVFGFDLENLSPGTVYHYTVTVQTQDGSISSGDRTFVTAAAPVLAPVAAQATSTTTEDVTGGAHLYAAKTGTVTVDYGTTTAYVASASQTVTHTASTDDVTPFTASLGGLAPGTLYHYRTTVSTEWGTVTGPDGTFVTGAPPRLGTITAVKVGDTTENVTVRASLFGAATGTVRLDWGPTTAYGSSRSGVLQHDTRSLSANAAGFVLTGLTKKRTYHYRATITTAFGTAVSADRTFVAGR